VVLVRRGKEPAKGCWSLPGGSLRWGETVAEGTRREVREETGMEVRVGEVFATVDAIGPDYHFVVLDSLAFPVDAKRDPCAADDVDAAEWVRADRVSGVVPQTPHLDTVVAKAIRLLDAQGLGEQV